MSWRRENKVVRSHMLRPTIGCSAESGRARDEAALRCKCCRARRSGQCRQASDGMSHSCFSGCEVPLVICTNLSGRIAKGITV